MFLSVVILGRFTTETHAMALLRQGPTRRHHLHHSPGRSPVALVLTTRPWESVSAKHSVATAAGFAASVHHEGSHGCGPSLPALQPVAGWSTAERIAPRAGAAPGREHLLERLHQPGG